MRYVVKHATGDYFVGDSRSERGKWSGDIMNAKIYDGFSHAKAKADGGRNTKVVGIAIREVPIRDVRGVDEYLDALKKANKEKGAQ